MVQDGDLITGLIEDSALPQLDAKGILYELGRDKPQRALQRNGQLEPLAPNCILNGEMGADMAALPSTAVKVFKIQLLQPLTPAVGQELARLKVEVLERVWRRPETAAGVASASRDLTISARMAVDDAVKVSELPFVGEVTTYTRSDTLSPAAIHGRESEQARASAVRPAHDRAAIEILRHVSQFIGAPSGEPDAGVDAAREAVQAFDEATVPARYSIRLHSGASAPEVLRWLETKRVTVLQAAGDRIRVILNGQTSSEDIADLDQVARVDRYTEPELHNDHARELLGFGAPASGSAPWPFEGSGQVIGFADTGLDDQHPAFSAPGKVACVVARGRPGNTSDPHGHGTHVAASALGADPTQPLLQGVAPKASIFFQSVLDANGKLSGIPDPLTSLFSEAYVQNVRIHNNSWGSGGGTSGAIPGTRSYYDLRAEEADDFVAKQRDMLLVFSAGNDGTGNPLLHASPGYVDWLSLSTTATAKNILTVGASRSDRSTGGWTALSHQTQWGSTRFPNPPIATDTISGAPDSISGASSRGPCDNYRIKPDVVAPGTDIVSAMASTAPAANFWGSYTPANYAYLGGTSMAAALVSGCAALVREYYMAQPSIGDGPSAALLKATLINSTYQLTGADAIADHADIPNYHQGFGRIHLPWAVPNPLAPWLKLEFFDNWRNRASQLGATGDRARFAIDVDAGAPFLRLCFAYTDSAGSGLNNDLNLIVDPPPGPAGPVRLFGNDKAQGRLGQTDTLNNVEIVRIENPVAGRYRCAVLAKNILHGPQDFALVVTGTLKSSLMPLP